MSKTCKTFKIGSWEFDVGMLETPTARKLVQLCFARGHAYWRTSFKNEFFVVAGEVLKASEYYSEFRMFPFEMNEKIMHVKEIWYWGSLSIVREDELDKIPLTPSERGKQDGIIARKSSKFATEL